MKTKKVNNTIYYTTTIQGIFYACFGQFWQYVQYNTDTGMYNPIYRHYAHRAELVSEFEKIASIYN